MNESAWDQFVTSIFPDPVRREYLRAMLAYAFSA